MKGVLCGYLLGVAYEGCLIIIFSVDMKKEKRKKKKGNPCRKTLGEFTAIILENNVRENIG
jgi:hypothetical protein